jgi:hypothetical protein
VLRANQSAISLILRESRHLHSLWPHICANQAVYSNIASSGELRRSFRWLCVEAAYERWREVYLIFRALTIQVLLVSTFLAITIVRDQSEASGTQVAYTVIVTVVFTLFIRVILKIRSPRTAFLVATVPVFIGLVLSLNTKQNLRSLIPVRDLGSTGAITTGILVVGVFSMFFVVVTSVTKWIVNAWITTRRFAYPHVALFGELVDIAGWLTSDRRFMDLRQRPAVLRGLERAAELLERGLPKYVDMPGSHEAALLKLRCEQGAAVLREYQLWIALPTRETRETLLQRLIELMAVIATGRYDALPVGRPSTRNRGERLRASANIIRSVIVGLLPFSVLWIAQEMEVAPGGSIGDWLRFTAIAWAILSLITLVDPLQAHRLALFRDLLSGFRAGATGR